MSKAKLVLNFWSGQEQEHLQLEEETQEEFEALILDLNQAPSWPVVFLVLVLLTLQLVLLEGPKINFK